MKPLSERLRDRTTLRFMGNCKCGNCQLVDRPLLDEAILAVATLEALQKSKVGEPRGEARHTWSEAIEAAAKVCDAFLDEPKPTDQHVAAMTLAERIRSLTPQHRRRMIPR